MRFFTSTSSTCLKVQVGSQRMSFWPTSAPGMELRLGSFPGVSSGGSFGAPSGLAPAYPEYSVLCFFARNSPTGRASEQKLAAVRDLMSVMLKFPMRQPSLSIPTALIFESAMILRASSAGTSGATVMTLRPTQPSSSTVAVAIGPHSPMLSRRNLMMSDWVMMLVRAKPSSPKSATRWMWSSSLEMPFPVGMRQLEGLRKAQLTSSRIDAFSACLQCQKPPSPPLILRSRRRVAANGEPHSSMKRILCSML
mmetsp:Transcript_23049/g.55146  ORF Transcript_23049/g.55146 Transcript_23049/m.55146 type:complete len:252 (+) Transcript_23049:339-1094(+)